MSTARDVTATSALIVWDEITEDVDGAPLDVDYYQVLVRTEDEDEPIVWTTEVGTETELRDLRPDTTYIVAVRGVVDGVPGDMDEDDELEIVTGATVEEPAGDVDYDDPLPPVPSVPVVFLDPPTPPVLDSSIGLVNVSWDGLLRPAADSAPDDPLDPATPVVDYAPGTSLAYVPIVMSSSPTGPWVPTGASFSTAGSIPIGDLVVGDTVWVALYAVDTAGNETALSAPVSVVVVGIGVEALGEDVNDAINAAANSPVTDARLTESSLTIWPFVSQTIPAGALADGAVETANLADFVISAQKLNINRHLIY